MATPRYRLAKLLRSPFGVLIARRFLYNRWLKSSVPIKGAPESLLARIAVANPDELFARSAELDALLATIPLINSLTFMAALEDRAPGILDEMQSMSVRVSHFRQGVDLAMLFDTRRLERMSDALKDMQAKGNL